MPSKHICKKLEHHDSNMSTNVLTHTHTYTIKLFVNQLLELSLLSFVRFPVARSTSGQSVPRWMEQQQQKARHLIARFRRDSGERGRSQEVIRLSSHASEQHLSYMNVYDIYLSYASLGGQALTSKRPNPADDPVRELGSVVDWPTTRNSMRFSLSRELDLA